MDTNRRTRRRPPRVLYIKEWREFTGVKVPPLAEALNIERQSYYRFEKNWTAISAKEMQILADMMGVDPGAFWDPPPVPGEPKQESLDELIRDKPEVIQKAARRAVHGIVEE
jgi:hypothetical protein